jgi:hypoxia up-regulated 1
VPHIQKALSSAVGEDKIARNVDGDEAAVLGAVLHGAAVSAQFKLGVQVRIRDLNVFNIQIAYEAESEGALLANLDKTPKGIKTLLFNDRSYLGSKKLMTFKRSSDFNFNIDYKYPSA